jgi:hypothetical protein
VKKGALSAFFYRRSRAINWPESTQLMQKISAI